ncbi:hypothetical protein [Roseibium sp. RKSG952]|uniref:hypothetical protein n=1 Tax=Roseibium sp. RKSG952 TaxID=2529384 RepID=UPI0012BC79FB|nr:hypothetical protein [Roseibium sp. RKSG952]MTH96694.1 hypothetical protein [Roseibium sp. RKSG952]
MTHLAGIENTTNSVARLSGLLRIIASDDDHDEVGRAAKFALSAIVASGSRIDFGGRRLSLAARDTVSAAAMSVVGAAVNRGKLRRSTMVVIAEIADLAISLSSGEGASRHVSGNLDAAPSGWRGREGGPFKSENALGLPCKITRRPDTPGGSWCLYVSGVPLCGAQTPREAAMKSDKFAVLLSTGRALSTVAA